MGSPFPWTLTATNNRTVIAYRDDATIDDDVAYTATDIVGDNDTLLEPGEVKVITIAASDITGTPSLAANNRFTLEVQTPVGAVLDITRQLPAELATVMQLH